MNFPFSGPTILIVFNEDDCVSCVNLVYESWEAARWIAARNGRVIGIAAVRDPKIVRDFSRRTRLPYVVLMDSIGWAEAAVGFAVHPLFVIASAEGRVISVLWRSSRATEQMPIGDYLRALALRPTRVRSGG